LRLGFKKRKTTRALVRINTSQNTTALKVSVRMIGSTISQNGREPDSSRVSMRPISAISGL
jgi:hypothetical protein